MLSGGFPPKELSEDLAFARVLTAHGAKIGLLKERMPMNTRRFEVEGLIPTFRIWIRVLLYHLLQRDFKKGEVEYKNIREVKKHQ